MADITLDAITQLFPNTPADTLGTFVDPLNKTFSDYSIDTPLRQAAFFAQVGTESGGFSRLVENLNYSADSLLRVFSKYFTPATAPNYARQPEKIANIVYANRYGNGDAASGDGWTYRGRGAIQITFQANYAALAADLQMDIGDVVTYLETPEGAVVAAGWFWNKHNLNQYADRRDNVTLTTKINGGLNGIDQRTALFAAALPILTALA